MSQYLRKVLQHYLSERKVLVGKEANFRMTCGVPQGSILGPTLWNVYYDGILKIKYPSYATAIAYADDLAIVVVAPDQKTLELRASIELQRVAQWLTGAGLQLASQKTEVIVIQGKNTIRNITIFPDDVSIIREKPEIKYLGVTVARNLRWERDITRAVSKASCLVTWVGSN